MNTALKKNASAELAKPQAAISNTPDLLNGPVASVFVRMSMPIILGLLVNGLFNFVDAVFISRAVGTDAIGGVSAAFPIHMMMISISAMLGSGMASILSRKLGAGLDEQANKIFSASMVLAGLVGIFVSVVIVLFCDEIFTLTQLPVALIPFAVEYITPIALFSVVSFLYGSLSEAFRAEGQNMQVMKLMALSALLNIALDVGYRTLSSFNRAFKDIFKQTPTAYRQACLLKMPTLEKTITLRKGQL